MVRVKGLEPSRLLTLEPKSSASANSAIPAYYIAYYIMSYCQCQEFLAFLYYNNAAMQDSIAFDSVVGSKYSRTVSSLSTTNIVKFI